MSLNFETRKWKEFFIGGSNGVFDISSASSGIDKNKLTFDEKQADEHIPYITRSDLNNGINLFVSDIQDPKYKFDEGNVITIGLDTQTIFFQPYNFFTGQNIQVLRHKNLNTFSASFIIPLLKVQMEKFNWGGNGATLGRLFKTKIMLPIDEFDKVDWKFMELTSRAIFSEKKLSYKDYSNKALKQLKPCDIVPLNSKNWRAFYIEEVAEIYSGRDIYDAERVFGKTPYISSGTKRNGISHFIGNNNLTLARNCLSVNRNGSVGYSYYHPYEALYSNDCRKLKLKSNYLYSGFFIAHQITLQRSKYNYGYKMGTGRLLRQKIMLPINDEFLPDFKYMDQYIRNLEYKKRKVY